MVYLRRPTPQFDSPHIDETGARIFSLPEIDSMYATGIITRNDIDVRHSSPSKRHSPTRFSVKSFEGEEEGQVMGKCNPLLSPRDSPAVEERLQIAPASVLRPLRVCETIARWWYISINSRCLSAAGVG